MMIVLPLSLPVTLTSPNKILKPVTFKAIAFTHARLCNNPLRYQHDDFSKQTFIKYLIMRQARCRKLGKFPSKKQIVIPNLRFRAVVLIEWGVGREDIFDHHN